jgi:predicted nucleic acid-binding Zn ribbon protein
VGARGKGKKAPEPLANVVAGWLAQSGLNARVEQAAIVPAWEGLVGPQIAAVTSPTSVTADGTLFVQVATNSWMTELSLMEPELLGALNRRGKGAPIRRIRWQLRPG